MRKFTIFTLITSVVVLVVGADIFVNDVMPKYKKPVAGDEEPVFDLPSSLPNLDTSGIGTANVLGADVGSDFFSDEFSDEIVDEVSLGIDRAPLVEDEYETIELPLEADGPSFELIPVPSTEIPSTLGGSSSDFEDDNFVPFSTNVLIREDQIRSAGFVSGYLEQEPHEGFLFKTIYVDDLYDVTTTKYIVKSADEALAKVYVFQIGPLSSLTEVYDVLKMRATEGLDMEVNETNNFAEASFYMNDLRRTNVAFLVVKIGAQIYGFSYPKEYHSQIKNLIKLLDMEF